MANLPEYLEDMQGGRGHRGEMVDTPPHTISTGAMVNLNGFLRQGRREYEFREFVITKFYSGQNSAGNSRETGCRVSSCKVSWLLPDNNIKPRFPSWKPARCWVGASPLLPTQRADPSPGRHSVGFYF